MIRSVYTITLILAKYLGHVIQHFYYSLYKCNWFQKENVLSVLLVYTWVQILRKC
jgi:hypothetical protein